MAYDKWKEMMICITKERKIQYNIEIQQENEYSDPELEKALSQLPSSELLAQPNGTSLQRASQPTYEQLSYSMPTMQQMSNEGKGQ